MIKKDIPGYIGAYFATECGKIYASERIVAFGPNTRVIAEKEKKQSNHVCGYRRVVLSLFGKNTNHLVHRLIAETFIPNPENKPFVNHIDGDKTNNHVSNLEWVTRQENELHAISIGKKPKGEKNGSSKISNEDAEYIRRNYIKRKGVGILAKRFGISTHQVRRIAIGESR